MKLLPMHPLTRFAVCTIAAGSQLFSQQCFTADRNGALQFEVTQQAPPPLHNANEASYLFFPETAGASQNIAALNTSDATLSGMPGDSLFEHYYWLWANRCQNLFGNPAGCTGWNTKGNPVDPAVSVHGQVASPNDVAFFTSYESANNCTLAQAAQILRYPPETVNS